jgi:Polysaccharide biosynthesis/export protein
METREMKIRLSVRAILLIVGMVAVVMWLVVRESQKVFSPAILSIKVSPTFAGRPITGERLVRPDGTISLGYYGRVQVAGLTPHEIRQAVTLQLRRSVPDATMEGVSIIVLDVNSRRPSLVNWVIGRRRFKDVKVLL